jgi:hypothetical protein
MCTTPILGTNTKDIMSHKRFTRILDLDKDKGEKYITLNSKKVFIQQMGTHESTQSRDKDSDTIYLGIEELDFTETNKFEYHPIKKESFPDIFFFVHDGDYILTLKRLYLIFCSEDISERWIIMSYSTYSLINRYSSFIYFILLHLYLLLFTYTYTYTLY